MPRAEVKAILFDLFGTVVDWRGSIVATGERITNGGGPAIDWGQFADRWRREGYIAPLREIVAGGRPWTGVLSLLRHQLDDQAAEAGLGASEADQLFATWSQLTPWADSVPGLAALRERYLIAPLSNGDFVQLTEISKWAGLPWDCIISTALFATYKPDPRAYLGAIKLLGLTPGEVMMVAAHVDDLQAANRVGMATAYVPRPLEWGPAAPPPDTPDPVIDLVATDFGDLATALCG